LEDWVRIRAKKIWEGWQRDGTYARVWSEWTRAGRPHPPPVGCNFLELQALVRAVKRELEALAAETPGFDPDSVEWEELIDPRLTAEENCEVIASATGRHLNPYLRLEEEQMLGRKRAPRAVSRARVKVRREGPTLEEILRRYEQLKPPEQKGVREEVEKMETVHRTALPVPKDLLTKMFAIWDSWGGTEESLYEWARENSDWLKKLWRKGKWAEILPRLRGAFEEYGRPPPSPVTRCPYCGQFTEEVTVIEPWKQPVPPAYKGYFWRCINKGCVAFGHLFILKQGRLRETTPRAAAREIRLPAYEEQSMWGWVRKFLPRPYDYPTPAEREDFEEYLKVRGVTMETFDSLPEEMKLSFIKGWRDWRWVKFGHGSP